MHQVTSLIVLLLLAFTQLQAQSTELLVEKLARSIDKAYQNDGYDKAVALATLGIDFLAPDDPAMQRLYYETVYLSNDAEYYDGIDGDYNTLSFMALDWSPNGRVLALATSESEIRIYNAGNWKDYTTISTNVGSVLDVAFSPDGRKLAYSGSDGSVIIEHLDTKEELNNWEHADYIRALDWSPNGKLLAAGGDENTLFVYNTGDGEQLHAFTAHSDWIKGVSFSSDGRLLAAASDDNTATVWSVEDGILLKVHRDHKDYCRDAAFSPKGETLATVSDDQNIYLYSPANENVPDANLQGHEAWVMSVCWSPDARMLATADNEGGIVVHNLRTDEQEHFNSFNTSTSWTDIDFSADGNQIAVTSSEEVAIYGLGQSAPIARILVTEPTGTLDNEEAQDIDVLVEILPGATSIHPSPDGNKLAIIDADYQVSVMDLVDNKLLYQLDGHEDWIRSVDWSPNGQMIATGSDDQQVGLWDANDGTLLSMLASHTDWVRSVAWSPDGKVLLSGGDDGIIRAWDPVKMEELTATEPVGSYVMYVSWSPKQQHFAGQDDNGYITIYSATNNKLLAESEEMTVSGSVRWMSDDLLIAQNSDNGQLIQWSSDTGFTPYNKVSNIVAKHQNNTATAHGPYIVLSDNTQQLLEGHSGIITHLEWSPDGKHLLSVATDYRLGIWTTEQSEPIALLNYSGSNTPYFYWPEEGSGFYAAGFSQEVVLPTTQLRDNRSDIATATAGFSNVDIQSYQIAEIFLSRDAVVEQLLDSGANSLLTAIANYYQQRADLLPNATADQKRADLFRSAAE